MSRVDGLRPRYRSALRYVRRHRSAGALGIRPGDLVLDVGSGQDPHPRANVLSDRFVDDNSERACGAGVLVDRPLVVADATLLPFPDKAFDFVFCAHLVEHMPDPVALLSELQRVARRGYIETPSKLYEKLSGWDFHRWFVSVEGARLILEPKDRAIFDTDLNDWFGRQMERPPFWRFVVPRLEELELLTTVVWDGEIPYEIRGRVAPRDGVFGGARDVEPRGADALHPYASAQRQTLPQRTKARFDRRLRRASDARVREVLESLECPQCRDRVQQSDTGWECPVCDARFPVVGDIHVMIV